MSVDEYAEPPSKRRRLSAEAGSEDDIAFSTTFKPKVFAIKADLTETEKQHDVGIREFVNPEISQLSATLKKRYTDFLVNEILPNHEVLHLRSLQVPKVKTQTGEGGIDETIATTIVESTTTQASKEESEPQRESDSVLPEVKEEDRVRLLDYFDEATVAQLLDLYQSIRASNGRKSAKHPTVRTNFTSDRSVRSKIHQSIREIFQSSIDSSTDHEGILVLTAAKPLAKGRNGNGNTPRFKNQRPGRLGWLDRGGEYLHFTVAKENKDTMEVISWLARQLKCNAKSFQFAGTKDRRAVTVQRCSAYRIEVDRLAAQNRTLLRSKVGDFEYHPQGLELGDLAGNEFVITLRDVQSPAQQDLAAFQLNMQQRLQSLHENGYLNYYGLQRFGTFDVRTDVIGREILKGDYQAACDYILAFSDEPTGEDKQDMNAKVGQDRRERTRAIQKWRQSGRVNEVLDMLPRKFSTEAQIIRHLGKNPNDPLGALLTIQRNMRLMYVHAYQSYVWNSVTSERIKLFGNRVVKGDLVLASVHKGKQSDGELAQEMSVDADGEQIIDPAAHDRAVQEDDVFERARPLTEEEANSGQFTIFDVVLPLPGYDIVYPDNEVGKFYKTFMASPEGGELDIDNMRRKQREFSLSGSYRKMVERIGQHFEVSVHKYDRDEEKFVTTDLELIEMATERNNSAGDNAPNEGSGVRMITEPSGEGNKVAVVMKFQLGSSQYATMALRELSRNGIEQHKPDFS